MDSCGINSVAWALGAVAGLLLGGALTSIDLGLILYIKVLVAAIASFVGRARIPGWLNAKKIAEKMNVEGVPAIVLNDKQPLANPSKVEMLAKINERLGPAVNALDVKFEFEVTVPPIQKALECLLPQVFQKNPFYWVTSGRNPRFCVGLSIKPQTNHR
jgi:hypothetical protein